MADPLLSHYVLGIQRPHWSKAYNGIITACCLWISHLRLLLQCHIHILITCTLFHLIIIPNKEANAKRSKQGWGEEKGTERCRLPGAVTNKGFIKPDYMPRKTAKGSQLFTKANKCISKMNAREFRQNWASSSVIVNVCRSRKDHPKGNGQQCFLSYVPQICPSHLIPCGLMEPRMEILHVAPISEVDSAKSKLSSKHCEH